MYNNKIKLPEEDNFTINKSLEDKTFIKKSIRWILIFFIILPIIFLFVHWQQTSHGQGKVIIFNPNMRPQNITALVSGRIQEWHIKEGMPVKKGQKLVEIIDNDAMIVQNLIQKQKTIQMQYKNIKLASETAKLDLERQKSLFENGIASRKQYEQAIIKYNEMKAKVQSEQSKLADVQIQISRQKTQTLYAPKDGQIVSVEAGGSSTAVSVGQTVATFLPHSKDTDFALEIFIDPNDMPLIDIGNKVRIQFEGWPIIQIAGWPSLAIGTFSGLVKVIDGYLQPNGTLRVIIIPDPNAKHSWPSSRFLRAGVSVKSWIILRRVTVGYEIWRKLNKFPKNRIKKNEQSGLASLVVNNQKSSKK